MAQMLSNPILWLLVIVYLVTMSARLYILQTFRRHLREKQSLPKSLSFYAKDMLDLFEVHNLTVKTGKGIFIDKYDHKRDTLFVTDKGAELASLAVLLHECGHAVQGARRQVTYQMTILLNPLVNSTAWLAFPLLLTALITRQTLWLVIAASVFIFIFFYNLFCMVVETGANKHVKKYIAQRRLLSAQLTVPFLSLLFATSLASVASTFQVFSSVFKYLRRILAGPPQNKSA